MFSSSGGFVADLMEIDILREIPELGICSDDESRIFVEREGSGVGVTK